jgi:hypothetical protein
MILEKEYPSPKGNVFAIDGAKMVLKVCSLPQKDIGDCFSLSLPFLKAA